MGGPAIVVKVLPDGWAYLIASAPGSEPVAVVLTPDGLRAEIGSGRWSAETEEHIPASAVSTSDRQADPVV